MSYDPRSRASKWAAISLIKVYVDSRTAKPPQWSKTDCIFFAERKRSYRVRTKIAKREREIIPEGYETLCPGLVLHALVHREFTSVFDRTGAHIIIYALLPTSVADDDKVLAALFAALCEAVRRDQYFSWDELDSIVGGSRT